MELARQILSERELDGSLKTIQPLSSAASVPSVFVARNICFVEELSDTEEAVRALVFRECAKKGGYSVALPLLCAVTDHNALPSVTGRQPRLLAFSTTQLPTAQSLSQMSVARQQQLQQMQMQIQAGPTLGRAGSVEPSGSGSAGGAQSAMNALNKPKVCLILKA
jgi:hypothetical protein